MSSQMHRLYCDTCEAYIPHPNEPFQGSPTRPTVMHSERIPVASEVGVPQVILSVSLAGTLTPDKTGVMPVVMCGGCRRQALVTFGYKLVGHYTSPPPGGD